MEVLLSQILNAVVAVKSVVAVDALKRIPPEYRQSFFGAYDLWLYVPVYDERLCEKCEAHAKTQVFRGTELRSTFPYLGFADEDKLLANVHPHCRCELYRIISPERYFRMLEKLEKREV
jgi:hypothetical protein